MQLRSEMLKGIDIEQNKTALNYYDLKCELILNSRCNIKPRRLMVNELDIIQIRNINNLHEY